MSAVSTASLRRLTALRLLWAPAALALGLFALILAWLLRPRGLAFSGDAALAAAIGSLGVMIALSALPLAADAEA